MKKKINLYGSYKDYQTKKKAAGSGLLVFSIILVLGLLIGAVGIRLNLEKKALSNEVSNLQNNVTSALTNQSYLDLQKNQEKIDAVNKTVTILNEGTKILDQKKSIDIETIDSFYSSLPDGVEITEASIQLPLISLTLNYKEQKEVHMYLMHLADMDEINSVSSKSIVSKEGTLSTMVILTMKGSY